MWMMSRIYSWNIWANSDTSTGTLIQSSCTIISIAREPIRCGRVPQPGFTGMPCIYGAHEISACTCRGVRAVIILSQAFDGLPLVRASSTIYKVVSSIILIGSSMYYIVPIRWDLRSGTIVYRMREHSGNIRSTQIKTCRWSMKTVEVCHPIRHKIVIIVGQVIRINIAMSISKWYVGMMNTCCRSKEDMGLLGDIALAVYFHFCINALPIKRHVPQVHRDWYLALQVFLLCDHQTWKPQCNNIISHRLDNREEYQINGHWHSKFWWYSSLVHFN